MVCRGLPQGLTLPGRRGRGRREAPRPFRVGKNLGGLSDRHRSLVRPLEKEGIRLKVECECQTGMSNKISNQETILEANLITN